MLGKDHAADVLVVDVDKNAMPIDEVDLGMIVEKIRDVGQCAGQQRIVAVEPAHDLAFDPRKAEIDRVRLAIVARADPRQLVAVLVQFRDGCVARAAVLHGIAECGILLIEHRLNGAPNKGALIKTRRDDRDHRRIDRKRFGAIVGWHAPLARRVLVERKQTRLEFGAPSETPLGPNQLPQLFHLALKLPNTRLVFWRRTQERP